MLRIMLLGLAASSFNPQTDDGAIAADRRVYEAARAKAGQQPAALVKLSLWCEAHGLYSERGKLLLEAISIESGNAAARGLLGLISYRGEWLSPENVQAIQASEPERVKKLELYHARRAEVEASLRSRKLDAAGRRNVAVAHEKLGAWCEQQGLKDEAIAHFSTAVQYDPSLDAPWKRLGYIKHHGGWMTRAQIVAADQEAAAQRKADRHWEALLRKWKADLGEKKRRSAAEDSLASVTDPRAVGSIMRVFGMGNPADQSRAVAMLTRIDGPGASKELVRLAVFGDSAETRERAVGSLKKREPRDYVGLLIALFQTPVQYKVQPIQGPGSQGCLLVAAPRFTLLRRYETPPAFELGDTFRGAIWRDSDGMPMVAQGIDFDALRWMKPADRWAKVVEVKLRTQQLLMEANVKAEATQQRIIADVNSIEQFNFQSAKLNERVLPVLCETAGAPASNIDQDGLNRWWYDRLGYSFEPPQKVQLVEEDPFPQIPPPTLYTCFAAGTPVRTMEGLRPIEEIRPGDMALSQDVTTGRLNYCPVLLVHHNPPSKTLRIMLSGDEVLVASIYHRFWRTGRGWAQARDLKRGDVLRTLGATARVISVEPGSVEPLFNLDVAGTRSFFAGTASVLVHDNTLPPARQALFDEPANLSQ